MNSGWLHKLAWILVIGAMIMFYASLRFEQHKVLLTFCAAGVIGVAYLVDYYAKKKNKEN
ncbi:hypothetical protein [Persicobacter psychrovividus]|uniref:Uncharacterized protein n=1 Tax=Persicobacter psychrovividus TaxID=387638 RepID=A0ABM7V9Y7_9BACT|nr:hypothetical protein PEPS_00110 [Persicobacter psychrovividus]